MPRPRRPALPGRRGRSTSPLYERVRGLFVVCESARFGNCRFRSHCPKPLELELRVRAPGRSLIDQPRERAKPSETHDRQEDPGGFMSPSHLVMEDRGGFLPPSYLREDSATMCWQRTCNRVATGGSFEHRQMSSQYLLMLPGELSPELEGR